MNPQGKPFALPYVPTQTKDKVTQERFSIKPLAQPTVLRRPAQSNAAQHVTYQEEQLCKVIVTEDLNEGRKQKKVRKNPRLTKDLHQIHSFADHTVNNPQDKPFTLEPHPKADPAQHNQNREDLTAASSAKPFFKGNQDHIRENRENRENRELREPRGPREDPSHSVHPLDKELGFDVGNSELKAHHAGGANTNANADKQGHINNPTRHQGQMNLEAPLFPEAPPSDPQKTMTMEDMTQENCKNPHPENSQDLFESFFQFLNQLSTEPQPSAQTSKQPDEWNLGYNETLGFFKNLPFTEMSPDQYMNDTHNIQPQRLGLPNEAVDRFKKRVDNATAKFNEGLASIEELFIFTQKVDKISADKENEDIQKNKEISGAFSDLSHFIWDHLQQFKLSQGDLSQESSMGFEDVREKINSQKFISELNDDVSIDELVIYFNKLMKEENVDTEDLKKNVKEMIRYDVLDKELAEHLFGEDFDYEAAVAESQINDEEPNPAEDDEFKNQYLAMSQDLMQKISGERMEEEKSNSKGLPTKAQRGELSGMNVEVKLDNGQQRSGDKYQQTGMQNHFVDGENETQISEMTMTQETMTPATPVTTQVTTTPATMTQVTATQQSGPQWSEGSMFQNQFAEFEEGLLPIGEEESEFGFTGEEEFGVGGFDDEN